MEKIITLFRNMPIILLFMLAEILSQETVWSQLPDKTYILGGAMSFGYENIDYSNSNEITETYKILKIDFNPEFGYVFTENFLVSMGLLVSITNEETISDITSNFTNTSYGLSAKTNYYFGKTKCRPYVGLQIKGAVGKYHTEAFDTPPQDGPLSVIEICPNTGLLFVIHENVGIELSARFSLSRYTEMNNDYYRDRGIISVGTGFYYFFNIE